MPELPEVETTRLGLLPGLVGRAVERVWTSGLPLRATETAARLRRHLEAEFEKKENRQIYWDDVPLFCYPDEYHLGIHPIRKDDVLEIDCLQELAAADPSYRHFLSTKEADHEKEKS